MTNALALLHLALPCLVASQPQTSEFRDYLAKPDSSYHFSTSQEADLTKIALTSQTWQGRPWEHTLLFGTVPKPAKNGLAVLFITGNGPRPGDLGLMPTVRAAAGLPTAFLFNIPNQPLYNASEDELIAYTFDQYLTTKDPSWPLLFPMTKSVLRAMDAIQEVSKNTANPIRQFIITGASKRGWTTWLTGASGDRRVVAIAPMVIDNLNLGKQMRHQLQMFGGYSEEIEAYTKRGLQAKFMTPAGRRLAEIVDPYTYRSDIKVPTLIITGSNDPYWTADACSQYWDDLKQPKWLVTTPNVGHNLGGGMEAVETLGAFCHAIAKDFAMPKEKWQLTRTGASIYASVKTSSLPLRRLTVWVAESDSLDFRKAKYEPVAVVAGNGGNKLEATLPLSKKNVAAFAEATYEAEGKTFRLCCPTRVFPAGR